MDEQADGSSEQQTRQWALILHCSILLSYPFFFVLWVVPILIWQIGKHKLLGLDAHGKNAANWLISLTVCGLFFIALNIVSLPWWRDHSRWGESVACFLLFFDLPVLFIFLVLGIAFPIIAGFKANRGEVWKYPLSITFLK